MNNKEVLNQMIEIYGPLEIDWMGYKITGSNRLTYHHITERRKGGKSEISNGALLGKKSHDKLHRIEESHKELYDEYQYWFRIINDMKCHPTSEIMAIMEKLKGRLESALEVNRIIKEEEKYYQRCMNKQLSKKPHKKSK